MTLRAGALPDLVLGHLRELHDGMDYPRAIADVLSRDEAAVSGCLSKLAAQGLVEFATTDGHRRYYALTDAGRAGSCPTCGAPLAAEQGRPRSSADVATAHQVADELHCQGCGEPMLEPSPSGLCGFCIEEADTPSP